MPPAAAAASADDGGTTAADAAASTAAAPPSLWARCAAASPLESRLSSLGLSSPQPLPLPVLITPSPEAFAAAVAADGPFVLRGVNWGPCLARWTLPYLLAAAGGKRVPVHVADGEQEAVDIAGHRR